MPRRLLRIFVRVLAAVIVLGLVAGAALLFLQFKVKGGDQPVKNLTPQRPSGPMNVLLLGSDSRADLTPQQQASFGTIPGSRADTIMLLHLDEQRKKVVLVQFPRDLRVQGPSGKMVKLNSTYSGGPSAVVGTISRLTGLPINHYVEVDFNGFNQITKKLGGVKVYFDKPIMDRDSGLNVPRGCVTIEGDQALAFVRARKIDSDFGRINRQQLFIKLMVDKIARPGTLLRPDKVFSLINVLSNNVKYDADLSLGDLKTIGLRLRAFNSGNLDLRVVPSSPKRIGGVDYVVANEKQSGALFQAIAARSTLPPFGRTGVSPVDPADVRLSVLNGTKVGGLAAGQVEQLRAKGFQVVVDGNASARPTTTVYFDQGYEEQARLVTTFYPAALAPKPAGIVSQAPVALVLGADFAGAKASPAPGKAAVPPPGPPAPKPPIRPCDR